MLQISLRGIIKARNNTKAGFMNNIKLFRKQLNLTQKALGALFDTRQSLISAYELGERSLPIKKAHRLVKLFNELGVKCTFEDVFPSDEEGD